MEEFEKVEKLRAKIRAEALDKKAAGNEDDEFKADETGASFAKKDEGGRMTVRNLRLREDTAKYLRNLDPNSAHYDPKTRSMRDNPTPSDNPNELTYAGDNFVRYTGDVKKFESIQKYAWESGEKGQVVNLQATPTQSEALFNDFSKRKEQLLKSRKQKILEKYVGDASLVKPAEELPVAQTEA